VKTELSAGAKLSFEVLRWSPKSPAKIG